MTEDVPLTYVVAFSIVYLVAIVVVMTFAMRWKRKLSVAEQKKRTSDVRNLVRINEATADVDDALSYQKRTNESARRRIRHAEQKSKEIQEQVELNTRLLEESKEANKKLAASYLAGTSLLGEHVKGMSDAADAARRASFERAKENTRLLNELERDIEALYKGAVTPEEVQQEVARLESELEKHRAATQDASNHFYAEIAAMLAASESTQRATSEEIKRMFVTKDEAQSQASELLAAVESSSRDLDRMYEMSLDRATQVESECGLRNSTELDGAKLDAIQTTYDEILRNTAAYTAMVDANDQAFDELSTRVDALAADGAAVSAALDDLKSYISANCVTQASVEALQGDLTTASAEAAALTRELTDAAARCEQAKLTCDNAASTCTAAEGAAAINLQEGGVVNVDNAGTLSLVNGTLSFCTLDQVCTSLT